MLMAKRPERLTEDQEGLLGKLTAASPEIAVMNTLMKGFSMLLRERRVQDFQTWTTDAMASGLPELKRFCDGLERDRAAVVAAIELPWSNVSVRPTTPIFPASASDSVGVWTSNDNDQHVGEAVGRPTDWRLSMKRANSAGKISANSTECR